MVPGARPNQAGQQLTEMRRVVGAMVAVALCGYGVYALLARRAAVGEPHAAAPTVAPVHAQARTQPRPIDNGGHGQPGDPLSSSPDTHPTAAPAVGHDRSSALAQRAWKALAEGRVAIARREAQACLQVDRTRGECRAALVASFTSVGDWEHAYTPLVDCLDQNPSNGACLSAMARYQVRHQNLDDAKRRVDALVALGDSSGEAALAIGEYALSTKDLPRACTSFQSACAASQKDACPRARKLCPSELRSEPATP